MIDFLIVSFVLTFFTKTHGFLLLHSFIPSSLFYIKRLFRVGSILFSIIL
jgi:hypothetical protein